LMSSQNPSRIRGNEVLNASAEKNCSRTTGQPLLVRTIAATPPKRTTDETTAIA